MGRVISKIKCVCVIGTASLFLFSLTGCSSTKGISTHEAGQSAGDAQVYYGKDTPEEVVRALFKAISEGDYATYLGIENEVDTQDISDDFHGHLMMYYKGVDVMQIPLKRDDERFKPKITFMIYHDTKNKKVGMDPNVTNTLIGGSDAQMILVRKSQNGKYYFDQWIR
jgi:hypothetical protein